MISTGTNKKKRTKRIDLILFFSLFFYDHALTADDEQALGWTVDATTVEVIILTVGFSIDSLADASSCRSA